ncbi:MAG TPA: chemotaxis protein CheA [Vicinamibacteria bacterium]|nr:chemotaxis protein CheA [Vicinamibacteria bacterium]
MDFDIEQLRPAFRAETEEDLAVVEQALLALEKTPDDEECVATVFRKFHTLKGNAATLELVRLSEFAHRIEDLLETLRAGSVPVTPELVTFLLQAVDVVRTVLPAAVEGSDHLPPAGAALLARLEGGRLRRHGPEAAGEPVSPSASSDDVDPAGEAARTLRIDVDRIDYVLRVASEIAIAGDRLGQLVEAEGSPGLADAYRSLRRLLASLHRSVSMVRMVPIGPLLRRQARTIRDVAGGNKRVDLVVSDHGVEVDNSVIEQLKAPLTHLVRNAVDHGVEDPEARVRAGKEATARIELRARHEGSDIVLEIDDDGAGLDRARILERARALGVVGGSTTPADGEIDRLIFSAGLSTARQVSGASGRGVGLDVVRKHVDSVGGSVEVESRPGQGTRFRIRMPLTLAIIEGLLGRVGGLTVVIPMSGVVRCLDFPPDLDPHAAEGVLSLRGQVLPYTRLRSLFRVDGGSAAREVVIVVERGTQRIGLAVDSLAGRAQIVVRPPGRFFNGLPAVAGLTILGDGQVAPILSVSGLLQVRRGRDGEAATAPLAPAVGRA